MKNIKAVLCYGRHEMPRGVALSVFGETIANPMDFPGMEKAACSFFDEQGLVTGDELLLFVTGLTSAVAAVINVCSDRDVSLTLMHFNRASGDYEAQSMRLK